LDEHAGRAGDALQRDVRQEEDGRARQLGGEDGRDRRRVVGELGQGLDETRGERDDEETVLCEESEHR
jgi:hypothetical protein